MATVELLVMQPKMIPPPSFTAVMQSQISCIVLLRDPVTPVGDKVEEDGWISVRWAFRLRWCDHIRALSAFLRCSENSYLHFTLGEGGGD